MKKKKWVVEREFFILRLKELELENQTLKQQQQQPAALPWVVNHMYNSVNWVTDLLYVVE